MAGLEARDAEARAGWPPTDESDNENYLEMHAENNNFHDKKAAKLFALVQRSRVSSMPQVCKICLRIVKDVRRHVYTVHYKFKRYHCHKCKFKTFRRYVMRNHLIGKHNVLMRSSDLRKKVTIDKSEFMKGKLQKFARILGKDKVE